MNVGRDNVCVTGNGSVESDDYAINSDLGLVCQGIAGVRHTVLGRVDEAFKE